MRRRLPAALCALVLLGALACTRGVPGSPAAGTAAAPPSPTTSANSYPGAVVPGWQPVRSQKRHATFDAPPSWSIRPDSVVIGYQTGNTIIAGSGSALFLDGFCPSKRSRQRVLAVLTTSTIPDLTAAATDSARRWADLAYRDDAEVAPTLTPEAPTPLRTLSGLDGASAKVTATLASVGPCGPPTGVVRTLAVSTQPGATVVLVLVIDTGVPEAAPETDLQQILTSLREGAAT